MKKLEILDQGVLYRNPAPGHVAVCAYYSSLASLSDEHLFGRVERDPKVVARQIHRVIRVGVR